MTEALSVDRGPAAAASSTPITSGATLPGASRHALRARSVWVLPRTIQPFIATAFDDLTDGQMPRLRAEGDRRAIDAVVGQAVQSAAPAWLADWLRSDIAFLSDLFREMTGSKALGVRLESVSGCMCPKFHADNNRFRLVTTYRGAGTEWLPPSGPAANETAHARPAERALRGHVVLMRGLKAASPSAPALLHRSPAADPTAGPRLFLAIEDSSDR